MDVYKGIQEFYNSYVQLEQIKRTGWVMRNVPAERLESVADHTLQVIMLAVTLNNELKLNFDISKLSQMCFIHDIGEAIIGDISEIDVDYDEKKKRERQAVTNLLRPLSEETRNLYIELWLEMEEQSTLVAQYAYQVDKLDAVLKAKKYAKDYNMPELFREFYEYQLSKGTFSNSPLRELFLSLDPTKKD
jgi:Predicted hydrolases of HD superfamily